MAALVAQSSPHDSRHVQSRAADINSLWEKVKAKTGRRKTQLNNAHQMHSFMADSRDLVRALYIVLTEKSS